MHSSFSIRQSVGLLVVPLVCKNPFVPEYQKLASCQKIVKNDTDSNEKVKQNHSHLHNIYFISKIIHKTICSMSDALEGLPANLKHV